MVGWKEIVLHETMSKLCKTDAEASAMHTSRWFLTRVSVFTNKTLFYESLWAVSYKGKETSWFLVPSFCVNRGQRLRSQDRKRVRIGRHRGNHVWEQDVRRLFHFSHPFCLTPVTRRCAVCWLPQSVQGHIKCLGFLFFIYFSFFCFNVCTSDILEVLTWYFYPSICIAGSNSEVNNSLYNGGKWSRTMSGYIALNAISFSVCRPQSALKVDTLHISCRERNPKWIKCTTVQGGTSLIFYLKIEVLKLSTFTRL